MNSRNVKTLSILAIVLLLITFSITLSFLVREEKCSIRTFLAKAKEAYYAFKNKPKPGISKAIMLDSFPRDIILNSNVINDTVISINNTLYYYVILRFYSEECPGITAKDSYLGSNVHLRLLPTNVTTTGGRLWIYEIDINGFRNIVKVYEIPFIIELYRLYGDSIDLDKGLILVRIYYNVHSNEWSVLWIVLKKAR